MLLDVMYIELITSSGIIETGIETLEYTHTHTQRSILESMNKFNDCPIKDAIIQ